MHDTFALSRIGLKPLAACLIADKQAGRRRFFSNRDLHFRFRLERCQHEVPAFLGAIVGIASSQTSANIDMKSQLSRDTFRELQFPCRCAYRPVSCMEVKTCVFYDSEYAIFFRGNHERARK